MFKKYVSLNLAVLIFFVADRIIKLWFLKNPATVIGRGFLFNLHLETNSGIAFGLAINQVLLPIVIILILIILVNLLVKAYKAQQLPEIFSFSLIIAGAVSNLLDRLRYGFVIDYIEVPWFSIFNLADSMITLGVVLLILPLLFKKEEKKIKVKDLQGKTLKAGGIIVKKEEGRKYVLLLYRHRQKDWTFPKGHCEPGEDRSLAAVREIKEETGIEVEFIKKLPDHYYFSPRGKEAVKVYMYLYKPLSFNLKAEHDGDQVEWVPIEQVIDKLTHHNLKKYFKEIKGLL